MIFRPIRWSTFWSDQLRLQLGFFMYGLAIVLMIRASMGNGPWSVLDVGVATMLNVKVGTVTQIVGVIVLFAAIWAGERIGWGTISNIFFIGFYMNILIDLIPKVTGNLPVQIGMFLTAVVTMGFASAIYISADSGAGPRDSLMIGLSRKTGLSIRVARTMIEVVVVTIGYFIGVKAGVHDHFGLGTVAFALLIGPSVQFAFRVLKVDPHNAPTEVEN